MNEETKESPDDNKTEFIGFYVCKEDKISLAEAAESRNVPVSWVMRESLKMWIKLNC